MKPLTGAQPSCPPGAPDPLGAGEGPDDNCAGRETLL